MNHYYLNASDKKQGNLCWEESVLSPFQELIVSWNGERPKKGGVLLSISVKTKRGWSPYLPYANWGATEQMTFQAELKNYGVRVNQDAFEVTEFGEGFRVKVTASEGVKLFSLHASLTVLGKPPLPFSSGEKSIALSLPHLSQFGLGLDFGKRLCSPTSTIACVRFLADAKDLDPAHFAQNVWDKTFDIYGNWVLNVAQASSLLGDRWSCFVARLSGLDAIYAFLVQGLPVVISIRGPITGSVMPYKQGHLVVVTGYDARANAFLCMDPAFPVNSPQVSYAAKELECAWQRRGRIAYLFIHK